MTNSADQDQKPTDLDLHCLLRKGMSCLARERLIYIFDSRDIFVLRNRCKTILYGMDIHSGHKSVI